MQMHHVFLCGCVCVHAKACYSFIHSCWCSINSRTVKASCTLAGARHIIMQHKLNSPPLKHRNKSSNTKMYVDERAVSYYSSQKSHIKERWRACPALFLGNTDHLEVKLQHSVFVFLFLSVWIFLFNPFAPHSLKWSKSLSQLQLLCSLTLNITHALCPLCFSPFLKFMYLCSHRRDRDYCQIHKPHSHFTEGWRKMWKSELENPPWTY